MAILQTTAYGDNSNDYSNRQFGNLLTSNLYSIEAIISMIEMNLNSMLRETINKAQYENSMITNINMLKTEISIIRNKEININTTTTTTLELN